MNVPLLTRQDVLDLLEERVRQFPSGRQWTVAKGISEAYLSDVRSGRRPPGGKILRAIGVVRVEAYTPIPASLEESK